MNRRDLEIVASAVAAAFLTEDQSLVFEGIMRQAVPNFDTAKFQAAVSKAQAKLCNELAEDEL